MVLTTYFEMIQGKVQIRKYTQRDTEGNVKKKN